MNATWEITIDGRKRTVTLAEFRAEIDARKALAAPIMDALKRGDIIKALAAPIMDALKRGDIKACADAQAAMRKRFA